MRPLLLPCLLLVMAGCSSSPTPPTAGTTNSSPLSGTGAPSYPTLNAAELFDAYEANVVAADAKYKDKPLALKGMVQRIDREGLGLSIVGDAEDHGLPPSIECRFHSTRRDELAGVKKGQGVTVVGTCTGSREDSRAWQKVVVTLDGCRLGK